MRIRVVGLLAVFSLLLGGMVVMMLSYALVMVDRHHRLGLGLEDGLRILLVSNTTRAPADAEELDRLGTDLHGLLLNEGVAIAVDSVGDGPAALGSFDTVGLFPWSAPNGEANGLSAATYRDAGPQVLLVSDSYTASQWERTGRATFLPPDRVVVGRVDPTAVPERTQYVYSLFSAPLSTGRYLVSARDPALVDRIAALLTEDGFSVVEERRVPLVQHLATSPRTIMFVAMIAGAFVSLGLVIANQVHEQGRRLRILGIFGATSWGALRRWLAVVIAVAAFGTLAGVFGIPAVFGMVAGTELGIGFGVSLVAWAATFVGVVAVTASSFLFGARLVSREV